MGMQYKIVPHKTVKITQCLHSYHKSSSFYDEDDSPVAGDELSEYDLYGMASVTPPRTRRRNRDRKQKQRDSARY